MSSLISLASIITDRLTFLKVLRELVLGDISGKIKERSQLHKIIEKHCWFFGEEFNLATSDRSFRKILAEHRRDHGLSTPTDDELSRVTGVSQIPDLFMISYRLHPTEPTHHYLLADLKAPGVKRGPTEVEQVKKQAYTILDSDKFDKASSKWDIFLVSTEASTNISYERSQTNRPFGCLLQHGNVTVWAFGWSELITKAEAELFLIKTHLEETSNELNLSKYIEENFPNLFEAVVGEPLSEHDSSSTKGAQD